MLERMKHTPSAEYTKFVMDAKPTSAIQRNTTGQRSHSRNAPMNKCIHDIRCTLALLVREVLAGRIPVKRAK